MAVIEGNRAVYVTGTMRLVEEDRELAWAEKQYRKHPSLRYLIGHYVEADKANNNGQIFPLDDLKTAKDLIANTPLNILHQPHQVVGHFLGAELMYPISSNETTAEQPQPYIEALAAFYRYYFPESFDEVEKAYKDGVLSFSMEAVPRSITCRDGCGSTFEYAGRVSPTYCACIQAPGASRVLNNPQFTGGALIFPPTKPGWTGADITELSTLLGHHAEVADTLYKEVQQTMPDMTAAQWEGTVNHLILMSFKDEEGEQARDFNMDQRKSLAKSGKALPDGSYPIENVQDLKNAIQAIGRAGPGKRAAVMAHIKKRAAALGATSVLPDDWK